jgi:hypothetical protein
LSPLGAGIAAAGTAHSVTADHDPAGLALEEQNLLLRDKRSQTAAVQRPLRCRLSSPQEFSS